MVLWFVIVLTIVGMSLSLVMYAHLLPFIGTLGDIKEYNMAYYGAQSSLERSLLVLRQREAWFDGAWGVQWTWFVWPATDIVSSFGLFDRSWNTLYRRIAGRSDTIPWTGMGNIEPNLITNGTSNDYNTLWYIYPQNIPLWYDSTPSYGAYRSDSNAIRSLSWSWIGLTVSLTLNDTIKNMFLTQWWVGAESLDSTTDYDGDGTSDDIAVDRWRKWSYTDTTTSQSWSFTILPRSVVSYNSSSVGMVSVDDESIRESIINNNPANGSTLVISNPLNQWWFNPLWIVSNPLATSHRIITDYGSLSGVSFIDLLAWWMPNLIITKQMLTLSLFSPLMAQIGSLYPFIQYKVVCEWCDSGVSAGWPQIAQPYFLINGESTIGHYTVTMQLKKWINNDGVVSQFTVIF